MTFGFSTTVDLLSWAVVLLLETKVLATIVLLRQDRQSRFATSFNRALWWSTKLTPLVAVPCMIAVALLQHRIADAWTYGLLMLFVVVAVPIVVLRRFRREASASGLARSSARS